MNRLPIARKTLRDQRMAAGAVGLVLLLMGALLIAMYPAYEDSFAGVEYPSAFGGFLGEASDITKPEGFLAAEYFSWVPLLLITIAIIAGSGTIAGEEANGTLDLLLAAPVRRRRVLLEKWAGIVVAMLAAAFAGWLGFLAAMPFVSIDIGPWRLLEASINMLPISLLFLSVALLASVTLQGRGAAAAAATGLVVVTYFIQLVAGAVRSLHEWQKLSPFYWADGGHVLLHGFDFARAGGMLAIAVALLVLAVLAFERRDIAAGQPWTLPWRRTREDAHQPEAHTARAAR